MFKSVYSVLYYILLHIVSREDQGKSLDLLLTMVIVVWSLLFGLLSMNNLRLDYPKHKQSKTVISTIFV